MENESLAMQRPVDVNKLRKRIFSAILLMVGLFIIYWVYSHSYISVVVSSPEAGQYDYTLINQKSGQSTHFDSTAKQIKKLVSKGTYQITVQASSSSYFSVIKTSGFLRTISIQASLQKEKSRQFVGDNPEACTNYGAGVLFSYPCSGNYSDIQIHVPATNTEPTYVLSNPDIFTQGALGGIFDNGVGAFALVKEIDDEGSAYYLNQLNQNLSTLGSIKLPDLAVNVKFLAHPYRKGFVAYDSSFSTAFLYDAVASKPQISKLSAPRTKGLRPQDFDFKNKQYLTLFASGSKPGANKESEVVISGRKPSDYSFNKSYTSGKLCGDKFICLFGDGQLDIYDVSGKTAKHKFSVKNVFAIENSARGFVAITREGLLSLDVNSRSGYLEYSFGDYKVSSINSSANGYVLNLLNNKQRAVALYVDETKPDSDSIDKKITGVQKLPEVKFVSINGKFIYVSADLGQLSYISSLKSYGYDPASKKVAADKINGAIDRQGIDRKTYSISSNAF